LLLLFSHVCHQTHLNHPFSSNNWVKSMVMAENGWLVGSHASHDVAEPPNLMPSQEYLSSIRH
jgi:hypothetical protein